MNSVLWSFILIGILSTAGFYAARFKILRDSQRSHQRPAALVHFYGWILGLWTLAAGMFSLFIVGYFSVNFLLRLLSPFFIALLVMVVGLLFLSPRFHARLHCEKIMMAILIAAAVLTILIMALIFFLLCGQSVHFFTLVPLTEFLCGTRWSPPTSLGHIPEPVIGHYGVVPLLTGTLLITVIAMAIAVPLGLLIAIYTAEYASAAQRKIIKPLVEILAGIPTIIYGFFALIVVAPLLHKVGQYMGLPIAGESALVAGVVMGLMIIPLISSLSDDALSAIPRTLRENSWALGATPSETIIKVTIPAAFPGIASAILLAFSRAIGETMLVVMAAGLTPHLTFNPLRPVTTITVQIVTLLTGDQEFNSPKTLSAFALGLLLFCSTLILNIIALWIMRWHREKYAL
jgi:phosphate transport system permease protein